MGHGYLDYKKRSQVMSRILSKNTKPEIIVRRLLHSMGYRFRIHVKGLPGNPDIVMKKHKIAVLVHGCFWHLHHKCRDGRIPKSRVDYWTEKLVKNKNRDLKAMKDLRKMEWKVLRFWECDIERRIERVRDKIHRTITAK